MNLEDLFAVWSHSYHVTAASNLPSIREARVLCSTRTLVERARRPQLVHQRRSKNVLLQVGGLNVLIRNQIPLDPESLDLGATATLEEYVGCLNSYVFFWPGTALGPTGDGIRMFDRANDPRAIVIRVPTRSLTNANTITQTCVATCNTGVAWTENGIKTQRGPDLFKSLQEFSGQPVNIHEICFKISVQLPDSAEVACSPRGPWSQL